MSVPRLIAIRYISIRSHSHLVSFMSAISIFGLSIGVGILITAMSIMNGFDTEMRENILGVVPHITLSTDENLELQEWENIAGSVSELSEVNGISPVINVGGVVETESGNSGVLVAGINPQMEENVSVIGKFFVNGELENLNDTRWGIVIGQSLAGQLKVNLGESVNLFSPSIDINPLAPRATFRQFEVVGIFKVGNQQLDNNLVIANIESIRALFKMRQNYNGLRLRTRDVLKVAETEGRLSDLVPEQILITSWTTQFGANNENIKNKHVNYLKNISYWREDRAIRNNIPKRWIFSDSELIKIITSKPGRLPHVLENLKHSMSEKDMNFIKSILNDQYIKPSSVNQNIDGNLYNERVNKCHLVLEKIALEYKLAPTLIANKRDIDAFARNKEYVKFLHGWRFKIFGKLLQ